MSSDTRSRYRSWHSSPLCNTCIHSDFETKTIWPYSAIRPLDIRSCRWTYTAILSSSSIFFSSATLRAHWADLNQNRPHARKWVRFENVCLKSGVSLPYTSGAQTPLFGQTASPRNLSATLTAYIFVMKHGIDNRISALKNTRCLLHCLKMSWTLVHKQLKTGPPFYPPSVNSAFYFTARLHTRRSANETQPNFAQR